MEHDKHNSKIDLEALEEVTRDILSAFKDSDQFENFVAIYIQGFLAGRIDARMEVIEQVSQHISDIAKDELN